MQKKHARRRGWIGVAIVAAAVVTALYFFVGNDDAPGPVTFQTADVDRGDIERSVSASGSVRPLVTVDVGSQLSGQISEIYVDFNSAVVKDDLLALIDPQTFSTRVAAAEADLAVAKANVSIQEATVSRAQAQRVLAERELARQKSLVDRGNVSRSVYDNAEAQLKVTDADLRSARAQLINAKAVVLQREATLEQARIDLDRTNIRSPINGIVIERSVDVGQTVAASLQAPVLFRIAQDLSQIQIEAQINEADIGSIAEDNPVGFTVDAYPRRRFEGLVRQVRLAPLEEQNVVTYTVIISARNPRQSLFPGMTATVRIITGKREDVLRLPNAALRFWPPGIPRETDGSQGPGRPGGFGGPEAAERMVERIGQTVDLSPEQKEELRRALQEAFEDLRRQRSAGGPRGPGGGRGGFRQRMDNVLRKVLTPDQMATYERARGARGGQRQRGGRPATVWVLNAAGEPERRRIRVGLGDDRFTEVIGGDLKEGDSVIVRAQTGGGR